MNNHILKINHIWAWILPVCLLLLWTGCEDKKADYIYLSSSSFTFSPEGSETFHIEVEASQAWTVEMEGNWIVEKEKDDNSITVGATATQSSADRTAQLVFRAGEAVETVNFSQLGTNVKFSMLDKNSQVIVISPGGKYIAGINATITGEKYEYTPFIIEVATGNRTTKPMLTENVTAAAISDEGTLVIMEESTWTSKYYNNENKLVDLKMPSGFGKGTVSAISSNGEIMVGYARKDADKMDYPFKWVNGEPTILEIPKFTLLDSPIDQGAQARGCSADGSIIYGSIWDDKTAVYWKEDNKMNYVGMDQIKKHEIVININGTDLLLTVLDRPIFYADALNISPNGKYLATSFLKTTAKDKQEVVTSYPAIYDFEKETTTIITDLQKGFEDGSGRAVSDDGLLSYSSPAQASTTGFVYDMNGKTTSLTSLFIKQEYGISFTTEDAIIYRFTNGGKTLLGINVLVRGSDYQYWYTNVSD